MPSNKMIQNLPVAYRTDPWITDLLGAIGAEYTSLEDFLKDAYAQLFLDSMTWRVAAEETEAGLPVRPAVPLSFRRSALSAKWQSGAKCDLELIRNICAAWAGTNPQVTYDGKKLVAVFCTVIGDVSAIVQTLRHTVPAHLWFMFTAKRAKETVGVSIGATQRENSSRAALPILEPEQSLDFMTSICTGADGARSRSVLPSLEPDQNLNASLTANVTPGGYASRAVLSETR